MFKRINSFLLAALCLVLALSAAARAGDSATEPVSRRGLRVVVAAEAPPAVRDAATAVLNAVGQSPLLHVMAGAHPPKELTDSAELAGTTPEDRAYDHLVLVGLPDDPLIRQAWQRDARTIAPGGGLSGFYIFGFGNLVGDVGYIESDRNPFLHSAAIRRAPFETEIVTITGTTPAGVALAADAFVRAGLVNGVVAAPGWKRPETTLLDRDPLAPQFGVPDLLPDRAGQWARIGVTQASEDEYRGVLADTGVEPEVIWRAKYYKPGVWDGIGAEAAFDAYHAGLHRRSYGNTFWVAGFPTEQDAAAAAPKIAAAAKLRSDKDGGWTGDQPPFGTQKTRSGPLVLWQRAQWVFMSTLPPEPTLDLRGVSPHAKAR